MPKDDNVPNTYSCDFCAALVSVRNLSKVRTSTFYCNECVATVSCERCGRVTSIGKHELNAKEILCEDCAEHSGTTKFNIIDLFKRGMMYIGGLLILQLLRSIDTLLAILIRSSDEIVAFRPFIPVLAVYENVGSGVLLLVIGLALSLFLLNNLLPIPLLPILTFPGTVVHEWAHFKACQYYGIHVYEVVYLQFSTTLGYVRHEVPNRLSEQLGISVAPFLFNTLIGLAIAIIASIGLDHVRWEISFILLWLAFSVGSRAIPSYTDTDLVWNRILQQWSERPWILLTIPIVLLMYIVNILRFAFIEVIYGFVIILTGIYVGFTFTHLL